MLCTFSLHIPFKNLSQLQKSLEEYFSSPLRCIYSIYIHSWAHVARPFTKVFCSDCMEGMPDRVNTFPPYSIRCRVPNTQMVCFNISKREENLYWNLHTISSMCELILSLIAQESISKLRCSRCFVSLPWHGLIQLRCRVTHNKVIHIYGCEAKQSLFPYSTRQRHLSMWQDI